ncbi:hypothetical protein NNJEOMEG_00075 [Fundidesulfovibrio magnetotacticus]|uniref:EF-hand domain-containing protein n=1 Tax=Fundidesulfovibrio magnetotacticus TaxID=2730080 RepID=A0A6V8LHS2_9BACT|nr:EF-hand domain-containing protein [Fundidesulfovibrio magnetotacticus]GFK92253.1 hypothetical protein NNJEOMEG_00075 [Fundidesulfovibrio magnetotacticus]
MRSLFALVVAVCTFVVFSPPVQAQSTGKHPLFDRLDADKDGYLTKSEIQKQFPSFTNAMFAQADADRDGKLSLGEWQPFVREMKARRQAGGL